MPDPIETDRPPLGPQPTSNNMIGRIKAILLQPKEEWPRIDAEPASARTTFMKWAVPLAAIPVVALFIGGQLFGFGGFGVVFKPSLIGGLTNAIVQYGLSLLGVWLIALIIDALAPNFGGTKNPDAAMKVAAYSYTASWVAGILMVVPTLAAIAGLLGLYSFYLLWLGLPVLMKAPREKATVYTVVTVVAAILVFVAAGAVTSAVTRAFAPDFGSGVVGTLSVSG